MVLERFDIASRDDINEGERVARQLREGHRRGSVRGMVMRYVVAGPRSQR